MQVQINMTTPEDIGGFDVFVTDVAKGSDGELEASITVQDDQSADEESLATEGDTVPIGNTMWDVERITPDGVVTLTSVASSSI